MQSVQLLYGRIQEMRVEGDVVVKFVVNSKILELVGSALQERRSWGALRPDHHLVKMLFASLFDLVAHSVVRLLVAYDVSA
jgi:hypothetical protein